MTYDYNSNQTYCEIEYIFFHSKAFVFVPNDFELTQWQYLLIQLYNITTLCDQRDNALGFQ